MGTYRRFSLSTSKTDDENIIAEFKAAYEDAAIYLDDENPATGSWREHEKDLAEFSKRYPDILFSLWVNDDAAIDDEDEYVVYAKNGLIQVEQPEKTYPDFDTEKARHPESWA